MDCRKPPGLTYCCTAENAGDSVSETLNLKLFGGSIPPTHPQVWGAFGALTITCFKHSDSGDGTLLLRATLHYLNAWYSLCSNFSSHVYTPKISPRPLPAPDYQLFRSDQGTIGKVLIEMGYSCRVYTVVRSSLRTHGAGWGCDLLKKLFWSFWNGSEAASQGLKYLPVFKQVFEWQYFCITELLKRHFDIKWCMLKLVRMNGFSYDTNLAAT